MFAKEKCVYLGKIIRTHGIHGDLVLATELQLTEQNKEEPLLIELDGGLVPFYLDAKKGLRPRDHQSYLIRFDHTPKKEDAERYVNCAIYLLSLPEHEKSEIPTEPSLLKGYTVHTDDNTYLGKVEEVLDFSGNILLRVMVEGKEVLLPFTEMHIMDWDSEARKIQLHIPEGLLEL